jgi:hypothetical protein
VTAGPIAAKRACTFEPLHEWRGTPTAMAACATAPDDRLPLKELERALRNRSLFAAVSEPDRRLRS